MLIAAAYNAILELTETNARRRELMKKIIAAACALALLTACADGDKKRAKSEPVTLTWWVPLYHHVERTSTSFSDNELYKELMKRNNVNIEFIHPNGANGVEVLFASEELPDLLEYSFLSYRGGPEKAIDDNIIIEIDSLMKKYSPNYDKLLKEHPEWDREVTAENGKHYVYAWLRGDESLLYWKGLQYRKDLFDRIGMAQPQTIAQWDEMIRAFKAAGVRYPLSYLWSFGAHDPFASAFNTANGFYQLDGIVKFAPFQPEYREYIQTLGTWFADGLLDPETFTQSEQLLESKIIEGQVGAYMGTLGGNMGNAIPKLKKKGISLEAAPTPVKELGDEVFQGCRDSFYQPSTSVAISTACKNTDAAARLLDYGYGEEGHMLYNFGIEGVSYEMTDNYPKYLPIITDNKDGLPMQYAMSKYMASAYGGPFVQDKREYEQYLRFPEQKRAVELWSRETNDRRLPINIRVSLELEAKDRKINEYCSSTIIKFITGELPMTEYDSFLADLNRMGAAEIIACRQEKMDKYLINK